MDKYYVIIAGNGSTSRANLEALVEDHFYANGDGGVLVLPYKDKPSQGQIFAAQWAKDKSKETIIYTKSGKFEGIPSTSVVEEDSATLAKTFKKNKVSVFLLWDDEDTESVNLLADLKGFPCFDLTDGLNALTATDAKRIEEPAIPTQEQLAQPKEEDDGEDEEEEGSEEDDSEEDDEDGYEESMEDIYFGVQAIAKIFAKALVEELGDALKTPLKGPEA